MIYKRKVLLLRMITNLYLAPNKNLTTMKRTLCFTCNALIAAAMLMTAGCKSTGKTALNGSSTDTLVTAPAYKYATEQDSTIECCYEVDYPQQSDSLAVGVKRFIAEQLATTYLPYNNEDGNLKDYPLYKGDTQKCDALVKHYADGTKRYFASQQKEMMAEGLENGWIPRFQNDVKIKKRGETSTYILYSVAQNVYLGGAHGSYIYTESTISKSTCRPLAQTVDTTKVMQMQPLLRKGILGYLKSNGMEDVDAKYKDYLFLPDDGHFPLPVTTPSLTKDGVAFYYQQYEIASYAVGIVSFTIPYAEIKPYLCAEAKRLVAEE